MSAPAEAQRTRLEEYRGFVAAIVEDCRTDPGRRSALRRSLGRPPSQRAAVYPVVVPLLPEHLYPDQKRACYAVAAMIAAQPARSRGTDIPQPASGDPTTAQSGAAEPAQPDEPVAEKAVVAGRPRSEPMAEQGLGVSLALAVIRPAPSRRALARDSAQRHLHLLVRQSIDGVYRHLPGIVRQIRAAGVPVDWAQLIDDLGWWRLGRDRVAERWLETFYRTVYLSTSPADHDHDRDQEEE